MSSWEDLRRGIRVGRKKGKEPGTKKRKKRTKITSAEGRRFRKNKGLNQGGNSGGGNQAEGPLKNDGVLVGGKRP